MTAPLRPRDEHADLVEQLRRAGPGPLPSDATVARATAQGRFQPTVRQRVMDVVRQVGRGLSEAGQDLIDLPQTALELVASARGLSPEGTVSHGVSVVASRLLDTGFWRGQKAASERERAETRAFYGDPTTEAGRFARFFSRLTGDVALGEGTQRVGSQALRDIRLARARATANREFGELPEALRREGPDDLGWDDLSPPPEPGPMPPKPLGGRTAGELEDIDFLAEPDAKVMSRDQFYRRFAATDALDVQHVNRQRLDEFLNVKSGELPLDLEAAGGLKVPKSWTDAVRETVEQGLERPPIVPPKPPRPTAQGSAGGKPPIRLQYPVSVGQERLQNALNAGNIDIENFLSVARASPLTEPYLVTAARIRRVGRELAERRQDAALSRAAEVQASLLEERGALSIADAFHTAQKDIGRPTIATGRTGFIPHTLLEGFFKKVRSTQ